MPEDAVPGESRFGIWLAKGPLAVSSHGDEKESSCVLSSFYKDMNPPYDLT